MFFIAIQIHDLQAMKLKIFVFETDSNTFIA